MDGKEFYIPSEGGYDPIEVDRRLTKAIVSGSAFDMGLGVYYSEKKFYGGISVSHLNKPKPDYKGEINFQISRTFFATRITSYNVCYTKLLRVVSFLLTGLKSAGFLSMPIKVAASSIFRVSVEVLKKVLAADLIP